MKTSSTSERLTEIMNRKGLKQIDIVTLCQPICKKYGLRLGRNDISQYVNGKVEPGQDKITVLSEALNVSEAWLMGYDVPKEKPKDDKTVSDKDLMFALFGGEVSDEALEEVKRFAAFVKSKGEDNN